MARQIKLTKNERIVLQAIIDDGGSLRRPYDDVDSLTSYDVGRVLTKLDHRGLVGAGLAITAEGLRAMAENRQTKPKGAHA